MKLHEDIPFEKFEGAGNDFILIDGSVLRAPLVKEQIATMCHRRFGIGADGLLLLEGLRMTYFNADGGRSTFCGNGLRCAASYLLQDISSGSCTIHTDQGRFACRKLDSECIVVAMPQPKFMPCTEQSMSLVDCGVPHAVLHTAQVEEIDVTKLGQTIRCKADANVNWVQMLKPSCFAIRTFERGVEAETLACGSGVMAAAFTFYHRSPKQKVWHAVTRSGQILTASFEDKPTLQGPARRVFAGNYVYKI